MSRYLAWAGRLSHASVPDPVDLSGVLPWAGRACAPDDEAQTILSFAGVPLLAELGPPRIGGPGEDQLVADSPTCLTCKGILAVDEDRARIVAAQVARAAQVTGWRDARVAEWTDPRYPGCCPRCGWPVARHAATPTGLDCPPGRSPALNAGHLPRRPR